MTTYLNYLSSEQFIDDKTTCSEYLKRINRPHVARSAVIALFHLSMIGAIFGVISFALMYVFITIFVAMLLHWFLMKAIFTLIRRALIFINNLLPTLLKRRTNNKLDTYDNFLDIDIIAPIASIFIIVGIVSYLIF